MSFVQLTKEQTEQKLAFIEQYKWKGNAATLSSLDANANVETKNIATLESEINKDVNIQINRAMMYNKIAQLYWTPLADEYIRQLETHEIYKHDETSLKPYCVSLNMFPMLTGWMKRLWLQAEPPKHLKSFCWNFINLVYATASQFAWAVATVEFLLYFDHFARKEYGSDYMETMTEERKRDISQLFQEVVYSINQPASARWYQSVFWNISVFDKHYFDSLFGEFVFPDWDKPIYKSLKSLQELFMNWFNKERTRAVLTFPVITAAMLVDDEKPVDDEFAESVSRWLSEWNSFFIYQSKTVDSLASCCRLRNELSDNTFSYSLGAGWVATGSISVMTINFNKLIQEWRSLSEQIDKIHKYQLAYREITKEFLDANLLPVYSAGFIQLEKQFLTIGINWMVEAAEYVWLTPNNNKSYIDFVSSQLKIIYDKNKQIKKETWVMFNTEFVPAENLWVKNAKWDKQAGLAVPRDCYNSYFFVVEGEDTFASIVDKFTLHGGDMTKFLDWGSALHLNLGEYLDQPQYLALLNLAARTGCNYFTTNVKITICNDCGNIDKHTLTSCPKCGSKNIDYWTRIIGYLKRVSAFSEGRQKEESARLYHTS